MAILYIEELDSIAIRGDMSNWVMRKDRAGIDWRQILQVLRDPRQKRFFKAKDMSDLFQLGDQYAQAPETAQIFAGVNSEIPLIEAGEASTLTTPTLPLPTDQAGLSSNGVSPDAQIGNNITPKIEEQGNHILRLSKDSLHIME